MNCKHAWAAGIIDGEGTICIERCGRVMLVVTNTDMRILCEFKCLYGGAIYANHRRDRPSSKPCWQWKIVGKKTALIIKKFFPYLVSKREQAKKALEFYK